MEHKKTLLVFNPAAGQQLIQQNLFHVLDRFAKHGFVVTAYPTQQKKEAYEMICQYGPDYDYIVCAGGDGTLNEAVDAMMTLPRRPIFGYLPCGSTNDFAATLELPLDLAEATDAICTGSPLPIDIGAFQQEHFSYVAAFGLFTDVSYGTSQNLKNMFGHAAYVLEGIKRLGNIRSYLCRITRDGEVMEDKYIFGMVTNSASVGGFTLPVQNGSCRREGCFELILLREIPGLLELQEVVATLLGAAGPSEYFTVLPADRVTVECEEPLSWTRDGEFGGEHRKAEIEICHNALEIMVPKNSKRLAEGQD
ncbi:MAG: diacylglycerol/lipid kinase family protein [Oscillospiraceae bacterium]